MFYSVMQAESLCESDPSLLFSLIEEGDTEVLEKILIKEELDFNLEDNLKNNVVMCLLKHKKYDLVLKYLDKVDINHQNIDGDTLAHILVTHNYIMIKEILDKVLNNRLFIPNIKNNLGETILDKSINNSYLYTTIKILSNKRFNSIDIYSFKNLYETYIKSNLYGSYSKLSNLEIILENLEEKPLGSRMRKLVTLIEKNFDLIKRDFNLSKTENLDYLINSVIREVIS